MRGRRGHLSATRRCREPASERVTRTRRRSKRRQRATSTSTQGSTRRAAPAVGDVVGHRQGVCRPGRRQRYISRHRSARGIRGTRRIGRRAVAPAGEGEPRPRIGVRWSRKG